MVWAAALASSDAVPLSANGLRARAEVVFLTGTNMVFVVPRRDPLAKTSGAAAAGRC